MEEKRMGARIRLLRERKAWTQEHLAAASRISPRTVQRAAIGTAVGAIIGAIAGGGKGAAIGAVIGAGAGAGSVYVQGRDDLDLPSGTEITIRATGPSAR